MLTECRGGVLPSAMMVGSCKGEDGEEMGAAKDLILACTTPGAVLLVSTVIDPYLVSLIRNVPCHRGVSEACRMCHGRIQLFHRCSLAIEFHNSTIHAPSSPGYKSQYDASSSTPSSSFMRNGRVEKPRPREASRDSMAVSGTFLGIFPDKERGFSHGPALFVVQGRSSSTRPLMLSVHGISR